MTICEKKKKNLLLNHAYFKILIKTIDQNWTKARLAVDREIMTLQNIYLCPASSKEICLSFRISGHYNILRKALENVMNPDKFKHRLTEAILKEN